MEKDKNSQDKNYYKVIISELRDNPIRKVKMSFSLMGIIPLLILFYILIGKNYLYSLFLGTDGFVIGISILISIMGFLVAYSLVINMVKKLMTYFLERRMADEEKTELLTAFTHDMKTPLAVIKTGLQNLIDGIGGTLNNMHREMAQICATAVNRATDFVNQILEISKVKISMLSLRRELIDFQQIVKDEVKEISALAQKNNQTVNCQIMTTDPKVWGDREKLSRAVMNLLSNAVKYTNIDGRIDVLVSSDENTVKLAVINTGPGIPADKLGAIFNKYERLEPNSKIEGTGLGLSIVKDIIDLHKGHITVKSELGKETEFDVVLPKDLRTAVRR